MPVTESFLAFVLEQLDVVDAITPKRMFGGVGIYAGDLFFALLANDVLYLKVDDSNRADFEAAGACPFQPYPDRPAGGGTMQYYEVPVAVLEDADELGRWAAKSIAVARARKTRKPRRSKPPSSSGKPARRKRRRR